MMLQSRQPLAITRLNGGFTLLELAVVLVVVGLLMRQILLPWGAVQHNRLRQQAELQIDAVLAATQGYAVTYHRLPCPATAATGGYSLEECPGRLSVGFVPSVTLGIGGEIDPEGRLLDPWGRPYRYAVSAADHTSLGRVGKPDFTTPGEMARLGFRSLHPDLVVCRQSGVTGCRRQAIRANQLPVVVLSVGADSGDRNGQQDNQDADRFFVYRSYSMVDGEEFDDIVRWVSESQLNHVLADSGFGWHPDTYEADVEK